MGWIIVLVGYDARREATLKLGPSVESQDRACIVDSQTQISSAFIRSVDNESCTLVTFSSWKPKFLLV